MWSQTPASEKITETVYSWSNKFSVTGPTRPSVWTPRGPDDIHPKKDPRLKDVVQLTPQVLASLCERVKQSLVTTLDTTDRQSSIVRVTIKPWLPAQSSVFVNTTRVEYRNGWNYEVIVPEFVERRKLLRGLVQVLLLEMGNRLNTDYESVPAIPMWLREGLTEIIWERDGMSLVAEANARKSDLGNNFYLVDAPTKDKVWKDPLSSVREKLKTTPPLSFSDLSVPVDDQIANLGFEHFQASAHLFVSELLQLPEGPRKLRTYIQDMFRFTHPQFALFDAYRAHFTSALEVEKWWSVVQVNFLGREDRARWPEKNALAKLNEILQPQVRIRMDTNSIPIMENITLKQLISDVEYEQQRPVLNQMLVQLQRLEWNLPPDLLKLVIDYHVLILNYTNKRDQLSNGKNTTRTASSTAKPVVKEALKQLEYLEILREDFAKIGFAEPQTSAAK